MRLLPKSLIARTALVIMAALMASQIASVLLFRHYATQPRGHPAAMGFISHLKSIRAALETIPGERHHEFIARLGDERGVRFLNPERDEVIADMEPAPDAIPAIRIARARLKEQFGIEADLYVYKFPRRNGALREAPQSGTTSPPQPQLIARFPVAGTYYFVAFPRSRVVEQDFSWAWIGWAVCGALLALAGAVFLMWRVNLPLKALARAAREIGEGKQHLPVTPMGPEEVKAVAVAFNEMRDDLARLDHERVAFLAGVSHDLRTPLARLRLGLEMLPAEPALRRDLEKDIEDINAIIAQFMDFARDESSEPLETVDFNLLVRGAAERAERLGAKIALNLAPLPALRLRPLAMQRLIGNLLDNALKYGGAEISLRTVLVGQEEIRLSVLDRGPGIPNEEIERLKQPFTRRDAARSGNSGAGLGLAIVERITRMHGGKFVLRSREGGGVEASLSLPFPEESK